MAWLSVGRLEYTLNGFVNDGVELGIGLLGREPFGEGSRKARGHAVIPAQAVIGLFPRITTRQRNHSQDFGILDELAIEVVLLWERELEHDRVARRQLVELFKNSRLE